MSFLFFFFSLLGLTRAYTDPKCLQVDILFVISSGNTVIPEYLNTNVRSFVKTVTDAFSTPDEVHPENRQYARFGVSMVPGSNLNNYELFGTFTRSQVRTKIVDFVTCASGCQNPDYNFWSMTSSKDRLDGYYGYDSVTTNRVIIFITNQVMGADTSSRSYLTNIYPLVIGIGMPGTDGNKVEQDPDSMQQVFLGSAVVYPDIEAALDPENGVISKIAEKFTAPSITCSGFGIFHNYYVPAKADVLKSAAKSIISSLNRKNTGFTVQRTGENNYPAFYDYNGFSYKMSNFYIYNSNYQQSTVNLFQTMLQTLRSGFYSNYAFLVMAHTDTEYQLATVATLVQEIIQYDVPIYVVDASTKFLDNQELFLNLTRQRPERIFNLTSYTVSTLITKLKSTVVRDFNELSCDPMAVSGSAVLPPSYFVEDGFCSGSVSGGTTWEYKPLKTTPPTTTRAPDSGIACGGVIFLAEMTNYISTSQHVELFEVVRNLKSKMSSELDFSFAQFGNVIYKGISLADSSTFDSAVSEAFDQYLTTGQPSGDQNDLIDILNQLAMTFISNTGEHYAVLLMSELDALQNPPKATSAAVNVANLGIDVYVLDYSSGFVSDSIWSTLTRGKPSHILKVANLTVNEIVNYFSETFVYDVNNENC